MPPDATPPPLTPPPLTPIAFIRAIAGAYARYGADPAPALARAGIAAALLSDDAAQVTARQLEVCAGAAMKELDDEALGWFSRRLPWGSYGLLARASLTAPDFGVAARRWLRHHNLLTSDIVLGLETSPDGARAAIVLREAAPLGGGDPGLREFCLLSVLRNALGFNCWLVDAQVPLIEAAFPFAAPPHAAVYPLLFGCPVRFAAPDARLVFAARHLSLSVRRDEAAMRRMLADALPLIVLRYRPDRLLAQRVRALLTEDGAATATTEAVAAALAISPRTLHRRLRREGTSLQALKDEARRAAAEALLGRTARPVKQVAAAVGFSTDKSFARAFKEWTGQTPATFRRNRRPPAG